MCAIIDADVASMIFDKNCKNKDSALEFIRRVERDKLRIVTGGKNRSELLKLKDARDWILQSFRSGRIQFQDEEEVRIETQKLMDSSQLQSNDEHVIALAKVSGARLLCTNDKRLMNDFREVNLLQPKGKVYKIRKNGTFDKHHKRLLDSNNCAT